MSLINHLRERANQEADPGVKKQRLAKIAEIEAGLQDVDERLARSKKTIAELQHGHRPFFSWTEFTVGLGIVAALVGSFNFGLSTFATLLLVCAVALSIIGVFMLRTKRKIKNLEREV